MRLYGSQYIIGGHRIDVVNGLTLDIQGKYEKRDPLPNNSSFSFFRREKPWSQNIPDNPYASAAEGYDFEPDDEEAECDICGCYLDYDDCSQCGGEGGRSLYEESPFEYAPDDWAACDYCKGSGVVEWCPNAAYHPRLIA